MPRNTLIQIRRGTSAEWNEINPVLSFGEPGLETDTRKVKYGDGTTPWFDLPYAGGTLNISDVVNLQNALDGKQAAGNYATLVDGLVPASMLPSYVDDVLEYANLASLPQTGETSKIYVTLDTNKTYRWSGSTYVEISSSLVQSVNGQTGIVVLDAASVGAAPSQGSTNITTVGAVTATSVNKVTITQPSTGATLTLANGKTLTASNTISLGGQDGAAVSLGAGGTVMYETSVIDGGSY